MRARRRHGRSPRDRRFEGEAPRWRPRAPPFRLPTTLRLHWAKFARCMVSKGLISAGERLRVAGGGEGRLSACGRLTASASPRRLRRAPVVGKASLYGFERYLTRIRVARGFGSAGRPNICGCGGVWPWPVATLAFPWVSKLDIVKMRRHRLAGSGALRQDCARVRPAGAPALRCPLPQVVVKGARLAAASPFLKGPVAQWLEPAAHNGLVAGSSPAGPTNKFSQL